MKRIFNNDLDTTENIMNKHKFKSLYGKIYDFGEWLKGKSEDLKNVG